MVVVRAAGGVLWRPRKHGAPEVALVHRERYDDWSLPKGKADDGEHRLATAAREVEEETGHPGRLGPFLARYRYTPRGSRGRARKEVEYWSMPAGEGLFVPGDEVDDLAWLPVDLARRAATYPRDRKVLEAFPHAACPTSLVTVIRNARAEATDGAASGARDGRQVAGLAPVLAALGITAVFSAPPTRCLQTVIGFTDTAEVGLQLDPDLGDPKAGADPGAAADRALRLSAAGERLALCVPGRAVAPLVTALARRGGAAAPRTRTLDKGGLWVIHLSGDRIDGMERYGPPGSK